MKISGSLGKDAVLACDNCVSELTGQKHRNRETVVWVSLGSRLNKSEGSWPTLRPGGSHRPPISLFFPSPLPLLRFCIFHLVRGRAAPF